MKIREVKKTDNFELAALLRKILIEMGVPKKGTAFEDPEIDCSSGCSKDEHAMNRRSEFIIVSR